MTSLTDLSVSEVTPKIIYEVTRTLNGKENS